VQERESVTVFMVSDAKLVLKRVIFLLKEHVVKRPWKAQYIYYFRITEEKTQSISDTSKLILRTP
jgi:hypothetical protein